MSNQVIMNDRLQVEDFVLAGRSIFTLVSKKTGKRYTYKVTTGKTFNKTTNLWEPAFPAKWNVKVLNGSDNMGDYLYIGRIQGDNHSFRNDCHDGKQSYAAAAFEWFWHWLPLKSDLFDQMEFYHAGRCGRCGRLLTVPSSIQSGIGPECAGKLTFTHARMHQEVMGLLDQLIR